MLNWYFRQVLQRFVQVRMSSRNVFSIDCLKENIENDENLAWKIEWSWDPLLKQ